MSLYSKVSVQAPLSFFLLIMCIYSVYSRLGALILLRLTKHSKNGKVVQKEQVLTKCVCVEYFKFGAHAVSPSLAEHKNVGADSFTSHTLPPDWETGIYS